MRAQARASVRALVLVLLMLTSTQLILLTSVDFSGEELGGTPLRSETLDNSGVVSIDIGSNHASVSYTHLTLPTKRIV